MTTEERVIAALNHEEPDRVSVWTISHKGKLIDSYP